MKNPLKAAFVAAIITAIVHTVICWIGFLSGAVGFEESPLTPWGWTIFNLIYMTILVTIWGIIYAKVYDLVPWKGVWKGLAFGLFIYLLILFSTGIYVFMSWGNIPIASGYFVGGLYFALPFGLAIGYLYKKE